MTTVVRLVVVPTIVAGVATLLWPSWLDYSGVRSPVATAPVVVAAEEIAEGRVIGRAAVTVARWPGPTIPRSAYSSIDSVVGRVARIHVFEGEAIVRERLIPSRTTDGLDMWTRPGKRAYAIRVNDAGIPPMIRANSHVDILVTVHGLGNANQSVAKIFMTNVRVLAITPTVQRGADDSRTNSHVVTLELTPEEIEHLAIAENQGSLSFALRGAP
jgi:pilus assembly protein CpaB